MSSSPIPVVLDHPTLTLEFLRARVDGLWRALQVVIDPRDARGLRYRLPFLLAAAVGAKTFIEIAEHAADLPAGILTELGMCSWSGPIVLDLRAGAGHGRSRRTRAGLIRLDAAG